MAVRVLVLVLVLVLVVLVVAGAEELTAASFTSFLATHPLALVDFYGTASLTHSLTHDITHYLTHSLTTV
jgi:hypothetical protein